MKAYCAAIMIIAGTLTTGCTNATGIYTGTHVVDRLPGSPAVKPEKEEGTGPGSTEHVVYMKDGSIIRGAIINQDRASITIKTNYMTMKIEKAKIQEIKYK
ncbi:MAG: hypothetical protein MUD12_16890 [Spirochaetes bacterium]|nr:hypothetical protein [Spirochaetota bacterium]